MTLNMAITVLKMDKQLAGFNPPFEESLGRKSNINSLVYVAECVAIDAMKELEQYRMIGSISECQKAMEKLQKLRDVVKNY